MTQGIVLREAELGWIDEIVNFRGATDYPSACETRWNGLDDSVGDHYAIMLGHLLGGIESGRSRLAGYGPQPAGCRKAGSQIGSGIPISTEVNFHSGQEACRP